MRDLRLAAAIHEIQEHQSQDPCGGCIELGDDLTDAGVGWLELPTVEQALSAVIQSERLAMAIHNVKGGSPMFGEPGECECREDAAAIADEYDRLGAERAYLRRLPWRENYVVLERLDRPGNRADGVR